MTSAVLPTSAATLALAERDLARSGLTVSDAVANMISACDDASKLSEGFRAAPALVFSYINPITGQPHTFTHGIVQKPFLRVRYLYNAFGDRRYDQPRGSGVSLYAPPVFGAYWRDIAANRSMPIVITEGEKKAIAGCKAGHATLALGGVSSFLLHNRLIPELQAFDMRGRPVTICYDSDAATNQNVRMAETRLLLILRNMGAVVSIARLPPAADGGKQGIDDILLRDPSALTTAVSSAQRANDTTQALAEMSARAYVRGDGRIVASDENGRDHIDMTFSEFRVANAQHKYPHTDDNGEVKLKPLADLWLQDPLTPRYHGERFEPDWPAAFSYPEAPDTWYKNTFTPLESEPGDVTPFIRLTEHLFSTLDEDIRTFPIKFFAYRAQNLRSKPAIMHNLLGVQGAGKTLWATAISRAFGRHGRNVGKADVESTFNGFAAETFVIVINEGFGSPLHKTSAANNVKTLVSEGHMTINEKFKRAKEQQTFCSIITTSNDVSMGNTSFDDRRSFVIKVANPPEKDSDEERALFEPMYKMLQHPMSGRWLMHYLLTYPLNGWEPPSTAPMTPWKRLGQVASADGVGRFVAECREKGANGMLAKVQAAITSGLLSDEDRINLMALTVRPFYTGGELFMIVPSIVNNLFGRVPMESRQGAFIDALRSNGMEILVCKDRVGKGTDNSGCFMLNGKLDHYFSLTSVTEGARNNQLTQAEFDATLSRFTQTFSEKLAMQHAR